MVISTPIISKSYPKYSQGLSIIEIMVALVISSILMAGVYIIFDTSKKTYTLQGEMAELNDNARFIMDEFKNLISETGYAGCMGALGGYINPFQNSQDNQTISTIDDVSTNNAFPRSDILTISYLPQLDRINAGTTDLASGSDTITLTNNSVVPKKDDTITVSDCAGNAFDTYTVKEVTISDSDPWASIPIILSSPLLRNYIIPVDIFLGNLNNPSQITYKVIYDNNAGFTLFRCEGFDTDNNGDVCDNLSATQQQQSRFVEGVENMQIRYGIDTDNDTIPDQYVNAGVLGNNTRVISIRVTLLMRTLNKRGIGAPGNPKTFNLDSALSNPSNLFDDNGNYDPHGRNAKREEGYRHRLFTTTIFVRNSVYPYN